MTVSADGVWVSRKMGAWVGRQQMTVSADGAEEADESADRAEGADESADGGLSRPTGRRQRPTPSKHNYKSKMFYLQLAAHLVH